MVVDLDLAIALWIVGGGESVGDLVLEAEARYLPAREVGPVIGDDDMRKSKANTMFCQRNLTICCHVTWERGTPSTHFVK